jgi:hypothetical protein
MMAPGIQLKIELNNSKVKLILTNWSSSKLKKPVYQKSSMAHKNPGTW